MALKSLRSFFFSFLVFILLLALTPAWSTQALSAASHSSNLPSLSVFISQVRNGQAEQLRGIYIPEILADPVVQQPSGHNEFVSPKQNVLTQFALASEYGSTGLLAHNNLAGASFSSLALNQKVFLVYGDGRVLTFVVKEILRFQALEPDNPSGNFVGVGNPTVLRAADVFSNVYEREGQVIFQTCIASGEKLNWGRLFVIAEPYSPNS